MILIAVASCAAIFSGCKKYDEGPRLSLHTKKARIANVWRFDKVLSSSGSTMTSFYDDFIVEFKKDGEYVETQSNITSTGTWEFIGDKEQIRLRYDNSNGAPSILTIRKLKNKEFWFENGDYEFHCKPK